jgi:hypothetical protein
MTLKMHYAVSNKDRAWACHIRRLKNYDDPWWTIFRTHVTCKNCLKRIAKQKSLKLSKPIQESI